MSTSSKISVITCTNNEQEYNECRFYLERLHIPEGYSLEIIPVYKASSMAEGYNTGMDKSDAKYKLYIHQDTFIINRNALVEAVNIFESDPSIGLMGVIGRSELTERQKDTMFYDRGQVMHNGSPKHFIVSEENITSDVSNVDGLFIMTSRDIPWREDVFDGWDFYDASQCREFIAQGHRVVVAEQSSCWCYHDNTFSNVTNYYKYKELYMQMYYPQFTYEVSDWEKLSREYSILQSNTKQELQGYIDEGKHSKLYQLFQDEKNRSMSPLRELEAISDIDYLERATASPLMIWRDGDSYSDIFKRLITLKHLLKRLEHDCIEDTDSFITNIISEYSVFAVMEVIDKYVIDQHRIFKIFYDAYEVRMDPSTSFMQRHPLFIGE